MLFLLVNREWRWEIPFLFLHCNFFVCRNLDQSRRWCRRSWETFLQYLWPPQPEVAQKFHTKETHIQSLAYLSIWPTKASKEKHLHKIKASAKKTFTSKYVQSSTDFNRHASPPAGGQREWRSYFACTRRSGIKDLGLHVRWQVGINGQNNELWYLRAQSPTSLL